MSFNSQPVRACVRACVPTVGKECSHLQVAAGQADDGGFVQLGGDGRRQGQQLGQLIKLSVLLLSARLCGVLAFLLHSLKFPAVSLEALHTQAKLPGVHFFQI